MPPSHISTNLISIEEYLRQAGYKTVIQPPTDLNPSEQLLIALGKDPDGKPLVVHLFWTSTEIEKENDFSEEETVDFLQFLLIPPFLAIETAMKDLTSMILNLNATLDMAGFGLYENEQLTYYRYVHICQKPYMAAEPILAIIVSIEFLIEAILPSLRAIALGHKSLKEIQQETIQERQEQDQSDLDV